MVLDLLKNCSCFFLPFLLLIMLPHHDVSANHQTQSVIKKIYDEINCFPKPCNLQKVSLYYEQYKQAIDQPLFDLAYQIITEHTEKNPEIRDQIRKKNKELTLKLFFYPSAGFYELHRRANKFYFLFDSNFLVPRDHNAAAHWRNVSSYYKEQYLYRCFDRSVPKCKRPSPPHTIKSEEALLEKLRQRRLELEEFFK